jgi:poly(A) polymerase
MYYDPIKQELYDYVGGRKDLEKGVIAAIGDPHERFLERPPEDDESGALLHTI